MGWGCCGVCMCVHGGGVVGAIGFELFVKFHTNVVPVESLRKEKCNGTKIMSMFDRNMMIFPKKVGYKIPLILTISSYYTSSAKK